MLEIHVRRVRELGERSGAAAIDGLVDMYRSLWTTHRDGRVLIPLVVRAQ